MQNTTTTALAEIDEIERSFLANIERGEQALAAAENDYQRLDVRDAARAAHAVTQIMGRRKLVRQFSVLVQRAERAIAKANPPFTPQEVNRIGNAAQGKNVQHVPQHAELPYPQLAVFRQAHAHITDEEFAAIVSKGEADDTPLTRQQLIDLGREKRQPHLGSGERNEDLDPDWVEGAINMIGEQVRDMVALLPAKSDRILDIVREDLGKLEKRLVAYPRNSARMEAKFLHLREMQERGVIPYSVWDFPFRDDYAGDKNYHGNCSPQIVEQCIWRLTDEGDMVIDPMVGSGTTIDVCARYNRRVAGYDLNPVRNDIEQADARHLPAADSSADLVFIHPPYFDMVRYSTGDGAEADLSSAASLDEFLGMLRQVFAECLRVLKPGKHLCVLLGDLVNQGRFQPLCRKAANILEDLGMEDAGFAVKLAHGDTSRRKSGVIVAELVATNNLKVSHDLILFFRKGE